jgi:hypothetical protein
MPRLRWLILAIVAIFSGPALGADPEVKQKPDPTEQLITKLFEQEVTIENINDIPLGALFSQLSKKYYVPFVIKDQYFKANGEPSILERKPKVDASQLKGLSLHQFLTRVLDRDSLGFGEEGQGQASYLIKGQRVEIVPLNVALSEARGGLAEPLADEYWEGPPVSLVVRQKQLTEVVEMLASRYDLSVVIGHPAADAPPSLVSARLLNVQPETALKLLAAQCGMRVVKKGNAYLITTRERAKELMAEELEKNRRKTEAIEPPKPPKPPFPPK